MVGPGLVPELDISDTQFDLLTGFGYALLNTNVEFKTEDSTGIGLPSSDISHSCDGLKLTQG